MSDREKKVIFITAFHPQISKNILGTDAFRMLVDSGTCTIVLLVPDTKKHFFERHYNHSDVRIEGIEMRSFVERRSEDFMNTLSRLLVDTHYLHYKRLELLDAKRSSLGYFRYGMRELIVKLFSGARIFHRLFRFADEKVTGKHIFDTLLDSYSPDTIFCTDLFEQLGLQLIREAKQRGIKTVGMVRSWDNCLSKGLLRVIPDVVMVNNEILKNEIITIHDAREENVIIVGLPQFDAFIQESPLNRDDFFRQNNLDPKKRLIVFAPAGSILSDTDDDICDILIKAKAEGDLPTDTQLFVRNHPQHPARLSEFRGLPDVFIQMPGEVLDPKTHKETELTPSEQVFLRDLMAHTDTLVWVATSLCLDALVFDVPQVVVNFDGYKTKDYYHSVKRYHDEDHMKKMFLYNPFSIAHTKEELPTLVSACLKNPEERKDERAKVRTLELHTLDGKAGERIAKYLLG
jgi:CDP-glycerol glycerophosphotransferase (TagB/SpsB family)